jgi:hypothetical protein
LRFCPGAGIPPPANFGRHRPSPFPAPPRRGGARRRPSQNTSPCLFLYTICHPAGGPPPPATRKQKSGGQTPPPPMRKPTSAPQKPPYPNKLKTERDKGRRFLFLTVRRKAVCQKQKPLSSFYPKGWRTKAFFKRGALYPVGLKMARSAQADVTVLTYRQNLRGAKGVGWALAEGGQRSTGAQMQAPSRGAQQMCAGARRPTGAKCHAHDRSGAIAVYKIKYR